MDFQLTEDQKALRETLRDFLEGTCPVEKLTELNLTGGKRGEPTGAIPSPYTNRFRRDCSLVPSQVVPQVICGIAEGFIRLADAINSGTRIG